MWDFDKYKNKVAVISDKGQVISYGYIQEQISLRQRKRILNPPTVRNFVPVLQQVIMMPLLSGIVSLKKSRYHRKDRQLQSKNRLMRLSLLLIRQKETTGSVIPLSRWKNRGKHCRCGLTS